MIFIDLYVPQGALDAAHRARVAERLVAELYATGEGAPQEVLDAGRELSTVLVHEVGTWVAGGRTLEPGSPPRYAARVTVPDAWREEVGAHLIALVTRVLAEEDADGDRLYREPHVWVQVAGLAEQAFGTRGKPLGSLDVVKMITESYRSSAGRFTPDGPLPEGSALDPVCGMTVPLRYANGTVEHEGVVYAFCSSGCKALFDEERREIAS